MSNRDREVGREAGTKRFGRSTDEESIVRHRGLRLVKSNPPAPSRDTVADDELRELIRSLTRPAAPVRRARAGMEDELPPAA